MELKQRLLEMTADLFLDVYPEAATDLKKLSYVDDVGVGDDTDDQLKTKTDQMDEILNAGGMKCKAWIYSQ